MENPATWNKCIKILNESLNYGNDILLTVDKVLEILINNEFLVGEDFDNNSIREIINKALIDFKYENDNQCCGNSIGNKIYFRLKALGIID
jgi:hypothetical protein